MRDSVDISKITIKFGGDHSPKDEKLIELLKSAYRGELLVYVVLVSAESIKTYSSFKPEISIKFREYFENAEKEGTPPLLYVYPENDHFVMSDDYNSYYLYKEKGYSEITCILLGDSENKAILEKSEPFQLPPPTATVI